MLSKKFAPPIFFPVNLLDEGFLFFHVTSHCVCRRTGEIRTPMKKFAAGARLCIELIFLNTDGAEFDICENETDLYYTSYEIKT
jgi:hypothetical protein